MHYSKFFIYKKDNSFIINKKLYNKHSPSHHSFQPMNSTCDFSKKTFPEGRTSMKSVFFNNTTIETTSANLEEEKKTYTLNFFEESIGNGEIFQIDVQIPIDYTVEQSLVLIVGVLNKMLKFHGFKLNPNGNYMLYQAKKNGKPKMDLPSKGFFLINMIF